MTSLTCFLICLWLTSFVSDCIALGANFHGSYNTSTPLDLNMSTAEENRITNGRTVAFTGEATNVVLVRPLYKSAKTGSCTGCLVSPNAVVTAAHCVPKRKDRKKEKTPSIYVTVGTKFQDNLDRRGQNIGVQEVHLHQNYGRHPFRNDIAVLRLKRNVPYPENHNYMQLGSRHGNYFDTTGKAEIYGWGMTAPNSVGSNELLRGVGVSIIDVGVCRRRFETWWTQLTWWARKYRIQDHDLCVEGTNLQRACKGDSGGPLLQDHKLVGIVSWGREPCLPDLLNVYTNVSTVWDFINDAAELGLDGSGSGD